MLSSMPKLTRAFVNDHQPLHGCFALRTMHLQLQGHAELRQPVVLVPDHVQRPDLRQTCNAAYQYQY